MTFSPLATGLITGASDINDESVERAMAAMLNQATKDELIQALMDMTGLVVALSNHADYQIPEILSVVS